MLFLTMTMVPLADTAGDPNPFPDAHDCRVYRACGNAGYARELP